MTLQLDTRSKTLADVAVDQVLDLLADEQMAAVAVIGSPELVITDLHYWTGDNRRAEFEQAVVQLVREYGVTQVAFAAPLAAEGLVWGVLVDLTEGFYALRWRPEESRLQFYDGKMTINSNAPGRHLLDELAGDFGVTAEVDMEMTAQGPFIGVIEWDSSEEPTVILGVTQHGVRKLAAKMLASSEPDADDAPAFLAENPLTEEILADEELLEKWHDGFREAATVPWFTVFGPDEYVLAEV